MTQPIPIHDQSPKAPAPRRITSISLTIGMGVLAALISFMCAVVLPKFELIYADFNVALPPVTTATFAFSRWFGHGGWIIIWLSALILPIIVAQVSYRRDPDSETPFYIWLGCAIVLFIVASGAFTVVFAALKNPMQALIQAADNPPATTSSSANALPQPQPTTAPAADERILALPIRYAPAGDGKVSVGYYDQPNETFYQWKNVTVERDTVPNTGPQMRIRGMVLDLQGLTIVPITPSLRYMLTDDDTVLPGYVNERARIFYPFNIEPQPRADLPDTAVAMDPKAKNWEIVPIDRPD